MQRFKKALAFSILAVSLASARAKTKPGRAGSQKKIPESVSETTGQEKKKQDNLKGPSTKAPEKDAKSQSADKKDTGVNITEAFTRDNAYLQRYRGYTGRWVRIWRGDHVGKIARRYGSSTGRILRVNRLGKKGRIYAGDFLFVPYTKKQAKRISQSKTVFIKGKKFIVPTEGYITSDFGVRTWWSGGRQKRRMHNGVDFGAPKGTIIVASKSGKVRYAGRYGRYGKTVILTHGNDVETLYAHCHKVLVKREQKVAQGQTIALVGKTGRSTGYHLHFEIRLQDTAIDPDRYLDLSAYSYTAFKKRLKQKKSKAIGPVED